MAIARLLGFALALYVAPALADEPPVALFAYPLAVAAGQATEITLRGLRLDAATAVTVVGPNGTVPATFKRAEKSDLPDKLKADRVGDTQVVFEVAPGELSAPFELDIVVETPAGKTEPRPLRAIPAGRLTKDAGDNDGFRTAMPIAVGGAVAGRMDRKSDVDVFRFDAAAGRTIRLSVIAARRGSALDAILTVYGPGGSAIVESDDAEGRDPIATFVPPADGTYFAAVSAADEREGPLTAYLLEITTE